MTQTNLLCVPHAYSTSKSTHEPYHQKQANTLYADWEANALSKTSTSHILLTYNGSDSGFTIGSGLFADRWLGTNLVSSSVSSSCLGTWMLTRLYNLRLKVLAAQAAYLENLLIIGLNAKTGIPNTSDNSSASTSM